MFAASSMISSVAFCDVYDILDGFSRGFGIDIYDEALPFIAPTEEETLANWATLFERSKKTNAMVFDDSGVIGIADISLGRINKYKFTANITAKVTLFDRRSYSARSTAEFDAEYGYGYGAFSFKRTAFGEFEYDVTYSSEDGVSFFAQSDAGVYILSLSSGLGGAIDSDELSFSVNVDNEPDFGDGWELVVGFPDGEPVYVKNGNKFSFDKVPSIKYKRYREGNETWYELDGLNDETKTNVTGLKLTYTAKTGVFKGSFKVYASNECCAEGKPKLKKYTVNVMGCIIDGVGYGSAVLKIGKTQYTYPVTIE